jgi:hypothetical protein
MPKKTKHPRLRVHVRRGAGGQIWTNYYYDGRPDGVKDTPLGNDYAAAVVHWRQLHEHKPRIAGTLEEAFSRWAAEVLPTYASAETRKGYGRSLKIITPVFGPATWDQVTPKTITGYLKTRSAKTQGNREMALLSVIWAWAVREELVKERFPLLQQRGWKNKEFADNFEVTDAIFDALYKHAEPHLRDALDLATATGMRVMDVVELQITDHRGDELYMRAHKTGKPAPYDLTKSLILPALLERRRAHKAPHFFVLTKPSGAQVTLRMLQGAFNRARARAIEECPEAAGAKLRYMRKRASKLAGSLEAAQKLLQHDDIATTRKHYPVGEKLRPTR